MLSSFIIVSGEKNAKCFIRMNAPVFAKSRGTCVLCHVSYQHVRFFFQLGAANIFRMTILTTVFFVFYVVFSDVFPTTKADLLRLLLMNC